MTAKDIEIALRRHIGDLYIPEFTFEDQRIDALVISCHERTARGFEIKVDRADFLRDKKWQTYSRFCSSLAVACPEGLIQKGEIPDPFGLLWVTPLGYVHWEKRAKNIQSRDSLAWTWRYLEILEKEIPRLVARSTEQVQYEKHELSLKAQNS